MKRDFNEGWEFRRHNGSDFEPLTLPHDAMFAEKDKLTRLPIPIWPSIWEEPLCIARGSKLPRLANTRVSRFSFMAYPTGAEFWSTARKLAAARMDL